MDGVIADVRNQTSWLKAIGQNLFGFTAVVSDGCGKGVGVVDG